MERECLEYGFNEEQTDKLLHGQNINYSGWLHSNEYRRNALADNVTAQVIMDENRNLFLHITRHPLLNGSGSNSGLDKCDGETLECKLKESQKRVYSFLLRLLSL